MELVNAVKERRSIRRFSDKSVSPELISKIVSNAVYAPSWKNTQTTRYIAIENSLIKNQIADNAVCGFEFNSNTIKNAPALIAVTTPKHFAFWLMKKGLAPALWEFMTRKRLNRF